MNRRRPLLPGTLPPGEREPAAVLTDTAESATDSRRPDAFGDEFEDPISSAPSLVGEGAQGSRTIRFSKTERSRGR